MNGSNQVLGIAQPVGRGFAAHPICGLPEPNPTEPAGETGFAAHPKGLFLKLLCRVGKLPDGGESAAAKTPTAVVGFASFGLTLSALPGAALPLVASSCLGSRWVRRLPPGQNA